MKEPNIEDLRAKFHGMFANIPLGLRRDIIAVIDEQPMSYLVCWLEVKNKTEMGDRILIYLDDLDLI